MLLLLASWMFLFPFVWMLATSVKTDEELMEPGILPPIEHFRPEQPVPCADGVRADLAGPPTVTIAQRWDQDAADAQA